MLGLELGRNLDATLVHGGALSALYFFDDKVPNQEALALSPQVGWLMLLGAVAVVSLFILNGEWWRRWWLTAEDPRSIGLYRIVFGFFVICNVNDLWEYFHFLFTDEGIFTADVARQVHASGQFAGFGDGFTDDEPWGFFDAYAVLEFLKGPKYSLLYFWDTPGFFWAHLIAFELCAFLFMIGFWTRTMGVLTFFLMNSIFFRNHLFWEGTELVYRVFLAYLICAKSGYAYSVDNWLRCRKLRKKGLLDERDGPGGGAGVPPSDLHPQGLQAVYRLIPAWPRRLALLQLATVYTTTGILKNGSVWAKGDAIYYAWNMDHFYRFYPQPITAVLGTNVLRVMTWVTHWGEALFFMAVFGVLTHWAATEKVPPAKGLRAVAIRACWATLIAVSAGVIWVTWPVHFTPPMPRLEGIQPQTLFVTLWVAGLLGLWWLWMRLARQPFLVKGWVGAALGWLALVTVPAIGIWGLFPPHLKGNVGARAGATVAWIVVAVTLPIVTRSVRNKPFFSPTFLDRTYTIDRHWVARWILGRRIWILWHLGVMGGIFVLMNIGQFQTGMLSQTFVYFTGIEVARGLRFVGHKLGRLGVPGIPESVRRGEPPLPAEDPSLPHLRRDAAHLPQWAMFATMAVFLVGIVVKIQAEPKWEWRWIWVGGFLFLAGVAFQQWRANRGRQLSVIDPNTGAPRTPWSYGPFGRFVIGSLLAWHVTAVAVWLLPDKDSLGKWRPAARQVFAKYLTVTQTDQGWGMFAPNPPRTNVFLKVLVTDQAGEVYDLKTDVYAPERKPIPWIWNDRMRKMNRRIIGGESGNTQWYRKWYARYICRKWALDHEGVSPKKVDLVKVWYKMPSPEETAKKGWYRPEDLLEREGAEKIEHTEHCKRSIMGQLPSHIRERYGLPPLPENEPYRPWLKHKKSSWERRRAKERGEEPPPAKNKTTARATARADKKD